jgi:polygalacturonase
MSKALKNKVKFNDTVDVVADFGATGNGTTDDSDAIQAAITADTKSRVI